jgi:hypothetical protein
MALLSECCGAHSEYAEELDLCPECMEHCDFVDDEEEEKEFEADIEDLQNY